MKNLFERKVHDAIHTVIDSLDGDAIRVSELCAMVSLAISIGPDDIAQMRESAAKAAVNRFLSAKKTKPTQGDMFAKLERQCGDWVRYGEDRQSMAVRFGRMDKSQWEIKRDQELNNLSAVRIAFDESEKQREVLYPIMEEYDCRIEEALDIVMSERSEKQAG